MDRSLLTMQDDHISTLIWHGGERETLDVRQLTANMDNWVLDEEQIHLLTGWGFGVFVNPLVVPQNDIRLITAPVERWRPETNSFHFTFGEMTITLEKVYMILGLPITGRVVTHTELDNPKPYWVTNWEDLRMTEKERAEMYGRGGVTLHKLRTRYGSRPEGEQSPEFLQQDPIVYTRAYLLFLIGGILFPTSSRDVVHPRYLQLIQDTDHIIDYAWGAAVLSYLYRCLSKAWERVLPGRPEIAPRTRFVLPRATAWARPVANRRSNPHHHTGGYRGDFDSFQMSWLTWQPYRRFYRRIDYSADDYDTDMMDMLHTALGRIPMIHFEMVKYVMPDRQLRQFGMLQHIPEEPVDHGFLRVERLSRMQRDNHTILLRQFILEWDSFVDTGMPIVTEGAYVPMTEYMYWYRRLESAMRLAQVVHSHDVGDWFYEAVPDFLTRYDRVMTEWRGHLVDRPSFKRLDHGTVSHKRACESSEDPLHVSQKRLRQGETVDVHTTHHVGSTAPPPSQQTPHTSAPPPTSVPPPTSATPPTFVPPPTSSPISTSVPVGVEEVETSTPLTQLTTPVTHPPGVQIDSATPASATPSLPIAFHPVDMELASGTPVTRGFVDYRGNVTSVPAKLASIFEIDRSEDFYKNKERRGGEDRRGDLTRPIKNRKIDWIFTHWWAGDLPYVFERHTDITMFLSKKQVQTLATGNELEDDVFNAYMELMDPYKKTGEELAEQIDFFKTYHRQFQGPDIQLCDYALFPTCTGGHWILFIVDLNKMKVLLVDPLREDGPFCNFKMLYSVQYYFMEKVLPCWLNYLDPQRFTKKFMKMTIVTARPKQDTGVDCGVYVCNYVDVILNGIRLEHAVWHPYDDVETFRYRITWKLCRGRARHLSAWGLTQRNLGL
ncbi:hypothetical protein AgCh_019979 [Apium graveolens]